MAWAEVERDLAARGLGCLGRAASDEPVFILRAQDMLAPQIVEAWADDLEAATRDEIGVRRSWYDRKVREARALAHEMRAWQELNRKKLPD